jgi:hypothetical protein
MSQTLHLKGNEFYAIQDLYEDLMHLPDGWQVAIGEGVKLRVFSDKDRGRVKVKGEILTIRFTLTIRKDSAFLIADECRSIENFVYDIETILRAGMDKHYPDIDPLSDAEAQDWVKRCVGSSEDYTNLIDNVKTLIKQDVYNEKGWVTGKYRMEVKRLQDAEPLLTYFREIYGGDALVAFYMQESGRDAFYLIVRDGALYYDPSRSEYFASTREDMERITGKIARGSFKDQGKIQIGS